MLCPHYGVGICQAAALLFVPDTLLLTKKNRRKSYTSQFTTEILHFYQKCDVWNTEWVLRLNIDYFTKLNEIELSM